MPNLFSTAYHCLMETDLDLKIKQLSQLQEDWSLNRFTFEQSLI